MKFKAEQFLKDIGLNLDVQILGDGSMVEKTEEANIVHLSSSILTNPETAIMRALNNLNATYGKDVVSLLKKAVDE